MVEFFATGVAESSPRGSTRTRTCASGSTCVASARTRSIEHRAEEIAEAIDRVSTEEVDEAIERVSTEEVDEAIEKVGAEGVDEALA